MKEWIRHFTGMSVNFVLPGDEFHVSYNPSAGGGIGMFSSDNDGAETALVKKPEYFILNGDWREQYEEVIDQGFDACMEVYKKNKKNYGSSWSSDYEIYT